MGHLKKGLIFGDGKGNAGKSGFYSESNFRYYLVALSVRLSMGPLFFVAACSVRSGCFLYHEVVIIAVPYYLVFGAPSREW